MGEIASEQNSTIILPIPLDLFRPYLSGPDGHGASVQMGDEERRSEEEEAERRYEETVGDAPSVIPNGEANP
jgi:hypothetical protein